MKIATLAHFSILQLICFVIFISKSHALPTVFEIEPNDTVSNATVFAGEAIIIGEMSSDDQDGYLWKISDVDAQKSWEFNLEGIAGRLTVIDVFRVEFSDNGDELTSKTKLFSIGSRDGTQKVVRSDLIFEPGEYILGFARGGGGNTTYRPPINSAGFNSSNITNDGSQADDSDADSYRLTIKEGKSLGIRHSVKPQQSIDAAFTHKIGSRRTAYHQESVVWYELDFTNRESDELWEISGVVPVGKSYAVSLKDSLGKELSSTKTNSFGMFSFTDLHPEGKKFYLEYKTKQGESLILLETRRIGNWTEGSEKEPNDSLKEANKVQLQKGIKGSLSSKRDSDYFAFTINEEQSDFLHTIILETNDTNSVQLCLFDRYGTNKQCRRKSKKIELSDLSLASGDWFISVDKGNSSTDYAISLTQSGSLEAGRETEPNDSIADAFSLSAPGRVQGRFVDDESDFYTFLVSGEPQLWRFQAVGEKITELHYYDGAGERKQSLQASKGQGRIRLDNIYLAPGRHSIEIEGGDSGTYTLMAIPLGQPHPDQELEPNDDPTRMQSLLFGQTRRGILNDNVDKDNYRFTLFNYDNISLSVTPASAGSVRAVLYWDGIKIKDYNSNVTEEPAVLKGIFPPGDYRVELSATKPSDGEYKLSLQREKRFGCAVDCEPNDSPQFASPIPKNFEVLGESNTWNDPDWYKLPIFPVDTTVSVVSKTDIPFEIIESSNEKSILKKSAAGYTGVIPANKQMFLEISERSGGEYNISLSFDSLQKQSVASEKLPIKLSLNMDTTAVAAFKQFAQHVTGSLVIENLSDKNLTLNILPLSSDVRWSVTFDQNQTELFPNETKEIPISVIAPADAWADVSTRISVKAMNSSGDYQQTYIEITPKESSSLINPVKEYEIAKELLGGFNLAQSTFGAELVKNSENQNIMNAEQLIDGYVAEGLGTAFKVSKMETDNSVTLKLSGDGTHVISGVIFQLEGLKGRSRYLRDYEISVSVDGLNFKTAHEGTLLPIKSEQSVVFPQPVDASYVKLLPKSSYDGRIIQLGEFKVIGAVDKDLSKGSGFNVASPKLGGHVVWSQPAISSNGWQEKFLFNDDAFDTVDVAENEELEWVIGFHNNRAAKLREIRWKNSATQKTPLVERVEIATSLESPIGPWTTLGSVELSPTMDIQSLALDNLPGWARFIKFTVAAPLEKTTWALPELIEVWEEPSGASYRSVLTEWGYRTSSAYFEHLHFSVPEQIGANNEKNTNKDNALLLSHNETVSGSVELGKIEHWYRVTLPNNKNQLRLSLHGEPTVSNAIQVETKDGDEVSLKKVAELSSSSLHVYDVFSEPDRELFIKVVEPPRNVVFAWDTSASVGAYLPVIYNSLVSYTQDLVPERDAANFLPFGRKLLLKDWYSNGLVLQTVLNDYPRKESSSAAETTLITASKALSERTGTKAIVLITDAATSKDIKLWPQLRTVQPRIFAIGLHSSGALARNIAMEQDLMQDWSSVHAGHYTIASSEGEMEVAFKRISSLLRSPAPYSLSAEFLLGEIPKPASLSVIASKTDSKINSGRALEFILDASGSMLQRINGTRRIDIAKEVLTDLLQNTIPAQTQVALRVFGNRESGSCRTDLELPLTTLHRDKAVNLIQSIQAKNLAKTPIAASLEMVAQDLVTAHGAKTVVLITDGEETCEGNPEQVIKQLKESGIDVTLNIVGFAIDDQELAETFRTWATLGGGRFFSASDKDALLSSVNEALQIPYIAISKDSPSSEKKRGLVDGDAVSLSPGRYKIVVESTPKQVFDDVLLSENEHKEIKLE